MVALAILRVEKLKSFGNVGGSEAHTARLQDTPNADPTKTNIRLLGSLGEPPLKELVEAKIARTTKNPPRKDAVLCSDIFLSASPEYFRPHDPSKAGEWDDQRMWDFANASKKWLQENYGDKCIRAELHLDEATPHIHAYVVPINDRTKKLSHKEMFGGNGRQASIKMSKLQDSYAAALAPLGISRGVKGSQATHTKVKEYYQAVNSEPLILELDRLAPFPGETAQQLFERIKADSALHAINHQLADRKFTRQLSQRAAQNVLVAEKSRQETEQRAVELVKENHLSRQQLDQLRDLPLEDVAWQLGLDRDTKQLRRWLGLHHIISISADSKFYDFHPSQEKGGGGSIDLVMHVNKCNFRGALAWLHDRFGESGIARAAAHKAKVEARAIAQTEPVPQFLPPVADETQWQRVHHYLTIKRKLASNLIQALKERGLIYADEQQNAVFVMRSLDEQVNGAFLRGTRGEDNTFMGYEKGTKRTSGWFWFCMGGKPTDEVERVVLCKSPIDAISLSIIELTRKAQVSQTTTMYLVADSPQSLPVEFLKTIKTIELAYDNTETGDQTAQIIKQMLPLAKTNKPKAIDWNQQLQHEQLKQEQSEKRSYKRGLEL
ncbi:MobV family relaxase [Nostoc sp. ChiQUE01b]|uniref:MobV family relaxase n=1 Tax=Nostoc sp. ChiQUE01b TaxID=3075376 RepID=UPI002AD54AD9|nr:MobV family relaxase [Nostoc sp. ChiQUE01b]MDZ8264262.1 MobV family relaxase [Nostoc sp. ChiQUE01b]